MDLNSKVLKFLRMTFGVRAALPKDISIEITTKCNFRCEMCYKFSLNLTERHMPLELYKAAIDKLISPERINLTGLGESLTHPNFLEMIDYAIKIHPGAKVEFVTNGHLLNSKLSREILRRPLNMVSFSIEDYGDDKGSDGVSRMGHPNLDMPRDNCKAFSELRKKINPFLKVRLLAVIKSEEQVRALFGFGARAGVDSISLLRLDVHTMPDPKPVRLKAEEERRIINFAKRLSRKTKIPLFAFCDHTIFMKIAGHWDKRCIAQEEYTYIDVDGNLLPCCILRKLRMGNIARQGLKDIWDSDVYKKFDLQQPHICGGCDYTKHNYKH